MKETQIVAVLEPGYDDYRAEKRILGPVGARIVPVREHEDEYSRIREINPVAILVRERKITAELIEAANRLRAIVRYGVGVDNVDLAAASKHNIYIANVPDYGAEHEVSDHAVALYLAIKRRLIERDKAVRAGEWGLKHGETIQNDFGDTLGLIGFGKIARKVCEKFRSLGFQKIVVHDPFLPESEAAVYDVSIAEPDDLCQQADVISLHAPLNKATQKILNKQRIQMLKPNAILINVARGGLVDEHALAIALSERKLFGAGIDVFEKEPIDENHPLLHTPNTVLTDHMAWYSERSKLEIQSKAASEVARVLKGQVPISWVNRWE